MAPVSLRDKIRKAVDAIPAGQTFTSKAIADKLGVKPINVGRTIARLPGVKSAGRSQNAGNAYLYLKAGAKPKPLGEENTTLPTPRLSGAYHLTVRRPAGFHEATIALRLPGEPNQERAEAYLRAMTSKEIEALVAGKWATVDNGGDIRIESVEVAQ